MIRSRLFSLILGVSLPLGLPIAAQAQANFEPTERDFPAQYVTKLYSELLGRAPDQASWRGALNYYNSTGCTTAALHALGKAFLTSPEFNGLNYDRPARILVTYRAVLNRDPSRLEIDAWENWLAQGNTFNNLIDGIYASTEFGALSTQICNSQQPGYQFGNTRATKLDIASPGFAGDATALQAQLDQTPTGGTVYLASRALIYLTQPLRVPSGVTLATTNTPRPNEYANMARLARSGEWIGPTVDLLPGAKLVSVWVDGQRGTIPNRYSRPNVNIRMLSGDNTSVIFSRVSNTRGATSIEAFGTGADRICRQNIIWGNLVTAYTSSHTNGEWSDGISVACENATIAYNTVIDSTDVALILFNVNPIDSEINQTSQVFRNTVIQAGNSGYAGIAIDPFFNANGGDKPGIPRFSFAGASLHENLMWTGQQVHLDIAIAAGTRPWFGALSYNGTGGIFRENTSGNLSITAGSGIVASGLLNTQIIDNDLKLRLQERETKSRSFFNRVIGLFQRQPENNCPSRNIIAAIDAGYASGEIQGPYENRTYDDCIVFGQ
ncbi:DUF4214 domain-containing protein [filamentous cyanobacterium LEGE 11480]|uniref:DUF4214 domain-containing protein n=1 Tax=Romeriopsis navalis LEGE 11480 TaxID=2777977 RepID=A0A928Z4J3_9CYAN|nr:DUF4214 domain-containing protein [Romeriopsis navalis]MBE9030393.1 DUF4214 domain-containing protein [Romeriopsis navalis LEGE 11480]